jgi:hypothetical protein
MATGTARSWNLTIKAFAPAARRLRLSLSFLGSKRFSLRIQLIGITVVAALLGAVAWAIK